MSRGGGIKAKFLSSPTKLSKMPVKTLLKALVSILFIALLPSPASAQTLYGGISAGLFPGEDLSAEFHMEFGKRWKDRFGLGLAYTGSFQSGVSVSYGIQGAGLQGRLELGRWLVSMDAGAVLGASHSTDWYCNQTYEPAFDPYFRPALGFRFGLFTLGMSSFFTTPLRFSEYDEKINREDPTICYGQEYLERFQRFTFTAGLNFPARKRK